MATKKRWYPANCGIHEYRRPTKVCALCKVLMAELKAEKANPPKKFHKSRNNTPSVESQRQNRILHVAFITSAKNRGKS